jgi:hypothetical protein
MPARVHALGGLHEAEGQCDQPVDEVGVVHVLEQAPVLLGEVIADRCPAFGRCPEPIDSLAVLVRQAGISGDLSGLICKLPDLHIHAVTGPGIEEAERLLEVVGPDQGCHRGELVDRPCRTRQAPMPAG